MYKIVTSKLWEPWVAQVQQPPFPYSVSNSKEIDMLWKPRVP